MRKLALSLLALALLASTAVASPDGWRQLNGAYINEGVEAQSDAIERGGSFFLNLEDKRLDMYPWQDGSGDRISVAPILPDGVTLTNPLAETNWGWKAPMSNGWSLWLVDVQQTKYAAQLDDFLPNGLAIVYGSIPVSEVPLTGEWRPKKIRFTASNLADFTASIQPTPDEGPVWVPGSIAIYHKIKKHNQGFRKYMTGKVAHIPRPLMLGWRNGQITGYGFGHYEDLGGGVFEKVFDMDAILASGTMTIHGIGAPTTVSVSSELGYSSVGSSYDTSRSVYASYGDNIPLGNAGEVSTFNFYTGGVASDIVFWSGIYEGGTIATATLKANSGKATTAIAGDRWYNLTYTGTKPVLTGSETFLALLVGHGAGGSINNRGHYDYIGGEQGRIKELGIGAAGETPPADLSGEAWITASAGYAVSLYLDYTESASPPVTTLAALTDTTPVRGNSPTLSATITDGDNTTTAAEWFVGADPGEGSGTSATLLGGSSPFTISEAVATAGLDSGVHVVSVRGFSSDGWGAVDTVNMTVSLGVPQNVSAVGGDETVDISWDAVTGATSYTLTWNSGGVEGSGIINDILTTAYTHTGRTNGVEYFYTVKAVDGGGQGVASSTVSAEAGEPAAGASWQKTFGIVILGRP